MISMLEQIWRRAGLHRATMGLLWAEGVFQLHAAGARRARARRWGGSGRPDIRRRRIVFCRSPVVSSRCRSTRGGVKKHWATIANRVSAASARHAPEVRRDEEALSWVYTQTWKPSDPPRLWVVPPAGRFLLVGPEGPDRSAFQQAFVAVGADTVVTQWSIWIRPSPSRLRTVQGLLAFWCSRRKAQRRPICQFERYRPCSNPNGEHPRDSG